jgi:Tfp pilus assembly protein PilF
MGDTEGADEDATWLMEHTEGIEEVLMLKARIEEKKGNKEEAEKYYEQVKKVNPFAFQ